MMGDEQLPRVGSASVGELDDLLRKLSTWDGSSGAGTQDEPTIASDGTMEEVTSRIGEDGRGESPSGEAGGVSAQRHLEMEEIEPDDIDVILRLSDDVEGDREAVNGGEAERVKVGSEVSSTGWDERWAFSHVWYACYGSNMWKKRFMCYIEGGKVEGMTRSCIGCRDKSPPVASEWLTIPNRLFFGHKSTRMWGSGGVAFLNPISEAGVVSHIRIYKITVEQFNDVLSQENPGRVERNWMTGKHIDELKKREPHHLMDIFGENSWYGTVKYLGEKDGLPILTFTCPESHMEKFRSGEFATLGPPDTYRNVIVHGLVDGFGFTEEEAHEYVSSATLLPKTDHKEGS